MLSVSPQVFEGFLKTVIRDGVFDEAERARDAQPLTEGERRRIAKGGHDFRPPKLVRLSGKGGFVESPAFAHRKRFRNVTLLDHVVSVTRGALVFAEIDLRAAAVDEAALPKRLAAVAATAFLHDADKMLEMSRRESLDASHVAGLAARYRVDKFLEERGAAISPGDLLQRIEAVEVGRVDRLAPGVRILTQDEINDCLYVRLADKLDGVFLDEDRGVEGVVEELDRFGGLRTDALRRGWRAAKIASPHTPFLLDALQDAFAGAVTRRAGMPPLIETHHDGILFLVAPEQVFSDALEDAIVEMGSVFSRGLRVDVNPRGTRDILDGGSTLQDLRETLDKEVRKAEEALFVHVGVLATFREALLSTFDERGFAPRLDRLDGFTKKHFPCWTVSKDETAEYRETRTWAAAFAIALACKEPSDRQLASRVPDAAVRERELIEALSSAGAPVPEWILGVGDNLSRRTVLAAYAACRGLGDEDIEERLLGDDGVVRVWLEGDGGERSGLFEKIGDPGGLLARAAGDWLRTAASRTFTAGDERLGGRCHFTATPVPRSSRIDSKTGLYGVKVSAFSGREGRPEFVDRPERLTLVAPVASAEHRLRALLATRPSGDMPVSVSSPTAAGLFASLSLSDGLGLDRYSLYDLTRVKPTLSKSIYVDVDAHEKRTAIGRHDAMPQRMVGSGTTPGLISFVKIVIDAAMRSGRAIHVFRGLPTRTNAFVAFDFLTPQFAEGIGGAELRLEQLWQASSFLESIERIAETPGLGLEVALRVLDPKTRFGAACETLVMIDRLDKDKQRILGPLRKFLLDIARDPSMQSNPHDSVIVEFASMMAYVQAAPRGGASNSERELGMRVALTQTDEATRIGQSSKESLICAITAGLENEFSRSSRLEWRGKKFDRPFPSRKAREAAEVFVERVWPHAFASGPPAGRARRVALAIYRTAFETESYRKRESNAAAVGVTV